jgi:hypothetical protein
MTRIVLRQLIMVKPYDTMPQNRTPAALIPMLLALDVGGS